MRVRTAVSALVTLVLVIGLFVFGKVTGGFFAWFLFYFCLVTAVYEWFTLFASLTRITTQRQLSDHRLTAGQNLEIRVIVQVHGFWPLLWLRIHEDLPTRWLFQLNGLDKIQVPLWRRTIRYDYTVQGVPRGVFQMGDTRLETGDMLGLVRVGRNFDGFDRVIVYPKVVPVRGWSGVAPDEYGDKQPTRRHSEESNNVIGVRDYVSGDRLSRIHWPMTARRGHLQAKEFELHVTSEFMFIPDNTAASYAGDAQPAAKFDLAMSITASLLRHAHDNHRKFGMVVPVQPHLSFPMDLNSALLRRCLESLAAMQPTSERALIPFLKRISAESSRGTVFVIVSPRLDPDMAAVVAQLRRQAAVHLFVPLLAQRLSEQERYGYDRLIAAGAQVHLIRKAEQLSFLSKGGTAGATTSPHQDV